MNPLDEYPKARKALYFVQWLYNGVLAVMGAVLVVQQTALEDAPEWYLYLAAIGPVLWTYLGITAQNNVPSVRDVAAGNADPAEVEKVVRDEAGITTSELCLIVIAAVAVVLLFVLL